MQTVGEVAPDLGRHLAHAGLNLCFGEQDVDHERHDTAMKTFDIITEADARVLPPGDTVTLSRRGHVTPLALDTLRERRITVVREGSASPEDLAAGARPPRSGRWPWPATIPASRCAAI